MNSTYNITVTAGAASGISRAIALRFSQHDDSPIAMADAQLQVNTEWNRTLTFAKDCAKELGHMPGRH